MRRTELPFPVSTTVARFVERLAALSGEEWGRIQVGISRRGTEVPVMDASRNAAIALAVRDLISREQFDDLYRPFAEAIPLESLEASPALD